MGRPFQTDLLVGVRAGVKAGWGPLGLTKIYDGDPRELGVLPYAVVLPDSADSVLALATVMDYLYTFRILGRFPLVAGMDLGIEKINRANDLHDGLITQGMFGMLAQITRVEFGELDAATEDSYELLVTFTVRAEGPRF